MANSDDVADGVLMQLRIEALGEDVVRRQLLRMAGRAIDASPAMDGVITSLFEHAERQFDSEGKHGGQAWTPPSATWTERKARLGLDPRTEAATQDLRRSLTQPGGDNIAVAHASGVAFTSTLPYAGIANARNQLIRPTEIEKRQWVKQIQQWIVEGDRSRGTGLLAGVI